MGIHRARLGQVSVEHRLQLLAEQAQHLLRALQQLGLPAHALGQGRAPAWLHAWQVQLASWASIDDCELLLCLRHATQVRTALSGPARQLSARWPASLLLLLCLQASSAGAKADELLTSKCEVAAGARVAGARCQPCAGAGSAAAGACGPQLLSAAAQGGWRAREPGASCLVLPARSPVGSHAPACTAARA